MIEKGEDFIQLCELNGDGDIVFTSDYLRAMKGLNNGPRQLAVELVDSFKSEHKNLLDYFGEEEQETDKYTGLDGDPMDVREDICELQAYKNIAGYDSLDGDWYRDLYRAKLLSIKLPKRLIQQYVKSAKKR